MILEGMEEIGAGLTGGGIAMGVNAEQVALAHLGRWSLGLCHMGPTGHFPLAGAGRNYVNSLLVF